VQSRNTARGSVSLSLSVNVVVMKMIEGCDVPTAALHVCPSHQGAGHGPGRRIQKVLFLTVFRIRIS
jgi:hypothetical protein